MLIFNNFCDFLNNADENDVINYFSNNGTYRIYRIKSIIASICSQSIPIKCQHPRFVQYHINRIPENKLCIITKQSIYISDSALNDMKKGIFIPNI